MFVSFLFFREVVQDSRFLSADQTFGFIQHKTEVLADTVDVQSLHFQEQSHSP